MPKTPKAAAGAPVAGGVGTNGGGEQWLKVQAAFGLGHRGASHMAPAAIVTAPIKGNHLGRCWWDRMLGAHPKPFQLFT